MKNNDEEYRILLVEDCSKGMSQTFSQFAYSGNRSVRMNLAANLGDAAHRLDHDRYSLVLLALRLPDCQGLETLKRVRRMSPTTPVAVLLQNDEWHLEHDARALGAATAFSPGHVNVDAALELCRQAQAEADNYARYATVEAVPIEAEPEPAPAPQAPRKPAPAPAAVEADDDVLTVDDLNDAAALNLEITAEPPAEAPAPAPAPTPAPASTAPKGPVYVVITPRPAAPAPEKGAAAPAPQKPAPAPEPSAPAAPEPAAAPAVTAATAEKEKKEEEKEEKTPEPPAPAVAEAVTAPAPVAPAPAEEAATVAPADVPAKEEAPAPVAAGAATILDEPDPEAARAAAHAETVRLRQELAHHRAVRQELEGVNRALEERCRELEAGQAALIEAEHVAIEREKAARAAAEAKLADLAGQMRALQEVDAKSQELGAELRSARADDARVRELESANAKLRQELDAARERLHEQRDTVEQSGQTVNYLRVKAADYKQRAETAESELSKMNNRFKKLQKSYHKVCGEKKNCEKRMEGLERENRTILQKTSELTVLYEKAQCERLRNGL